MKLEISIQSGSKTSDHKFELPAPASAMRAARAENSPALLIEQQAPQASPQADPGCEGKGEAGPEKTPREGKDGTLPESRELLHFIFDGETLSADGEEISPGVYSILIDGRSYEAQVSKRAGDAEGYSSPYLVTIGVRHYLVEIRDPRRWRRNGAGLREKGPQEIVAPMPGKIVKVLVSEHQEVAQDQGLLVIEAMKMQNVIRAPRAGRVERIYAQEASGVEAGFRLLRIV